MIRFKRRESRLLLARSTGPNQRTTDGQPRHSSLQSRPPTATAASRRPSLSLITSTHYLLICIMVASAVDSSSFTSSSSAIRGHRLKSNTSTHTDRPVFSLAYSSSPPLRTQVLNNHQSLLPPSNRRAKAMSSVHSSERSSFVVSELSRDSFRAFALAVDRLSDGDLSENRANNQTRRSLGVIEEVNNLTHHSNAVRATLSPLLPRSSTVPPIILYEEVRRPPNDSPNSTAPTKSEKYSLPVQITIAVGLLALIIVTTIGNIFVIGECGERDE